MMCTRKTATPCRSPGRRDAQGRISVEASEGALITKVLANDYLMICTRKTATPCHAPGKPDAQGRISVEASEGALITKELARHN